MSSNLINSDEKDKLKSEIFLVDLPKIDLIKQNAQLINYLFQIEINIASTVLSRNNTQKQIKLQGKSQENIYKSRKLLEAICSPKEISSIQLDKELINKLEKNDCKNELMRKYTVFLSIGEHAGNMSMRLFVQGESSNISQVTEFIKKIKCDKSLHKDKTVKENEEEIIWIDDPYEQFDSTSTKITHNKDTDSSRKEIENQMNKLKFNNKNMISPSIQNNGPIPKKPNTNQKSPTDSELEIIDITETNVSTSKVLSEYGELVQKNSHQQFHTENEKFNKQKRLSTLIAAMPKDKQQDAISQINKYQARTSRTSIDHDVKKDKSSERTCSENSILVEDISTSILKPQKTADFIALSKPKNPIVNSVINDKNSVESKGTLFIGKKKFKKTKHQTVHQRSRSTSSRLTNTERPNINKVNASNFLQNAHSSTYTGDLAYLNSKQTPNVQKITSENFNVIEMQTNEQTSKNSVNNNLRFIIIDGSNVAREHGNQLGGVFSCKGIQLVVDHFVKRGHKNIKAMIPRFRRGNSDIEVPTMNPEILDKLEKENYLTYTPSRYVQNKLICPYDDRFILKAASHYNAIIVSNDNYRDLMLESAEWKQLIESSLLQYSFVGDLFLIADDPMGRKGPHLDHLLSNASIKKNKQNAQVINNMNNTRQKHTHFNNRSNMTNQFHKNYFSMQPKLQNTRCTDLTSILYKRLIEIFPTSSNEIRKLLDENQNEKEIDFFTHRLLDNKN